MPLLTPRASATMPAASRSVSLPLVTQPSTSTTNVEMFGYSLGVTPARPNATASAGFDAGMPAESVASRVTKTMRQSSDRSPSARTVGTSECNHRSIPRSTATDSDVSFTGALAEDDQLSRRVARRIDDPRTVAGVGERAGRSHGRSRPCPAPRSPMVPGSERRAKPAAGCPSTTAAMSSRSSTRCAPSPGWRLRGLWRWPRDRSDSPPRPSSARVRMDTSAASADCERRRR